MFFSSTAFLVALLLYLSFQLLLSSKTRLPKAFPPGPVSLPLIGGMWAVGRSVNDGIARFRRKYGKVFGFTIGSKRLVVIGDIELMQDAMNRDVFQVGVFMRTVQ